MNPSGPNCSHERGVSIAPTAEAERPFKPNDQNRFWMPLSWMLSNPERVANVAQIFKPNLL